MDGRLEREDAKRLETSKTLDTKVPEKQCRLLGLRDEHICIIAVLKSRHTTFASSLGEVQIIHFFSVITARYLTLPLMA